MAEDERQSPHIYIDAVGFSTLIILGSQEFIQSVYRLTGICLNELVLKFFVKLYGGSMKRRSTNFDGKKSTASKIS